MFPKARREKLTIRDLPDETLVFDHERDKAHCLNCTVALVWRHCDGQTSVAELTRILHETLAVPAEEAVVQLALEQLGSRNLLEQPVVPLAGPARQSRREVLKLLARAAVALPLVMTIPVLTAAAGLSQGICSGVKDGTGCGPSFVGKCCGGQCITGGQVCCNGKVCAAGQVCCNGNCCARGEVCCNGRCVNPASFQGNDANNCGACGKTCPAGFFCLAGSCRPITITDRRTKKVTPASAEVPEKPASDNGLT